MEITLEELDDKFLAQKEAIKYKKQMPKGCSISFADGFEYAMKLTKEKTI